MTPPTHETSTHYHSHTPTSIKPRGFKMTDYRYSTPDSGVDPSSTMHWGSWMTWGSEGKSTGTDTGPTNGTRNTNDTLNWRPKYYTQNKSITPLPTTLFKPAVPQELVHKPSTAPSRCHHPLVDPSVAVAQAGLFKVSAISP